MEVYTTGTLVLLKYELWGQRKDEDTSSYPVHTLTQLRLDYFLKSGRNNQDPGAARRKTILLKGSRYRTLRGCGWEFPFPLDFPGFSLYLNKEYFLVGFPNGSSGKESSANAGEWVWKQGQEDPLKKEMANHSSILAWKFPWTEEPGGLPSHAVARVGHNLATYKTRPRKSLLDLL